MLVALLCNCCRYQDQYESVSWGKALGRPLPSPKMQRVTNLNPEPQRPFEILALVLLRVHGGVQSEFLSKVKACLIHKGDYCWQEQPTLTT